MEEKAIAQLSEQQRALQKEKEAFQAIRLQKQELIDALRQIQGRRVTVLEIMMNAADIQQCRESELMQQERLRDAKTKVDARRRELIEAVKQRKSMERLKTRHWEEYRSNADMLERAATDEMGIVRHSRRKEE